jgi:hypothetical protein
LPGFCFGINANPSVLGFAGKATAPAHSLQAPVVTIVLMAHLFGKTKPK